jgi:Heparinase II/III-like protein/Heparinase II/III N-terminus
MIARLRKLTRLGPHPILILRYVAHQVARRLHDRRLRRRYDSLVARAGSPALRLDPIELPPASALPASAERLRAEAEAVVAHEVDYLGSGPVSLGLEIDWQRDFKSGHAWPPSFYLDVEVTRLDDDSDAKVPWELSRGHQLLTLARARVLTGDERYAVELERQLASWLDRNPPGRGINWTNPMEVAIRATNWVWALRTIEHVRPLDQALRQRVAESLAVHARHIAANLEGTPYLRSNHYLADVLGLLVIGASLEGREADSWFAQGREALEREIVDQVHEDGLGFEASLAYHGLALEMFLVAAIVAGDRLSNRFRSRLHTMLDASASVRHPDGRVPQFGDNDSGRVLPAGFAREPSADNLLWLGAAAIGWPRVLDGPPHEDVAWILGRPAWEALAARPQDAVEPRSSFPDGGVYVLRNERWHVPIRCGDVGQNGNGGHAHNDLLSYELSLDGTVLVVDSGTYVYTSDPKARNAFRSAAAHNTVVVDDREPNPIDADQLFALRQVAKPSVESWTDGTRLVASHDGYRPVAHRRTFELAPARLVIVDEIDGAGDVEVTSFVHLAAGASSSPSLQIARDGTMLQMSVEGADTVQVAEGFVSDRYGERTPAPVVIARARVALPARLVTTFEARV